MSESEINSSPEEKENVLSDYYTGFQNLKLQSAETEIQKARNAIFIVAGLTLVGGFIRMAMNDSFATTDILITLILSAIFVGLGFFAKKQPLGAIIIALVLYAGLWIVNIAVLGIAYIYKGIIVNGLVVYYLARSIPHAREAENLRKEMMRNK